MVIRQKDDLTQIGVLEDKVLVEHYVARESQTSLIGNVYLGRVQNVLPSMEAAFIDIGKGRNAVLYAGEVNWAGGRSQGRPAAQDRVGALLGPDDPGAGQQGPRRSQGRPADRAGQPAGPLPGLRAGRQHLRDLAQAPRHRAQPPQDPAQADRPRHGRRHRPHGSRGRLRGGAHPRRRAADRTLDRHRGEGQGRQVAAAALRRARPHPQGRPGPVHRGLRQAGRAGRRRLGPGRRTTSRTSPPTSRTASSASSRATTARTCSRPTGWTSRSPRASTARCGCPRVARWSSTAPRR